MYIVPFYFTDNENNVAIGISNNYIQTGIDIGSPNFLSGSYGWRIQPDGTAEFQNLKVDGNLDVYVITYNEMRATNGIMLVTDCGCIIDAVQTEIEEIEYWVFTIDEYPPFFVDDYVQLQYKADETRIFSFKGLVTAVGKDGKNTVRVLPLSGFHGEGTSNDDRGVTTFATVDPDTAYGKYLIRIGNKSDKNRQTIIKLNPYDGGYIDFMTGLNSPNQLASDDSIKGTLPTATRIGNLAGVTYKGTSLEGYGLFSDNAYLSGAIKNLEDKWSLNADGSGQVANRHIEWDKNGNLTIKIGDTNITEYINNIANELEGKISSTKTELEGKITATAEALTSDYTKKITDTTQDLEGKISTATTELEGKISQTANNLTFDYTQKITNVNNKISTVESNFTQTADSISTRVRKIEDDYVTSSQLQQTADSITAKVGNFDVGGTNLLQGTKFFNTDGTNLFIKDGHINATEGDFKVMTGQVDDEGSEQYRDLCEWQNVKVEEGSYYTLSFWASGLGTFTSFLYHVGGGCVAEGYNSDGNKTTASDGNIKSRLTNEFKKYWITWKVNSSDNIERVLPVRLSKGSDIQFYGVKFEKGNVPTDWSPAPADNDNGYATSSELTMTADSIRSRVTTIENNYVKSSEISQTADDIRMSIYNEMNDRTGIDVTNGKITLDADNTDILGNLTLYDAEQGITLLNTSKTKSIQILNDNIGKLDEYNISGFKRLHIEYNGSKAATSDGSYFTINFDKYLGNITKDTTLYFHYIVFNINGDNLTQIGSDRTISQFKAKVILKDNNGEVIYTSNENTITTYAYTTRSFRGYFLFYENDNYQSTANQKLTMHIEIKVYPTGNGLPAQSYWSELSGEIKTDVTSLTKIAIDGIVAGIEDDRYLWYGKKTLENRGSQGDYCFIVRNGDHNFKISPLGIYRSFQGRSYEDICKIDDDDLWGDISSTVPTSSTYSSTCTVTLNQGFIVLTGTNNRTVTLPDPSMCKGKMYYVKAIDGGTTTITCTNSTSSKPLMMEGNSNTKRESLSIGTYSSQFISTGTYWVHFCGYS